MDNLGQTYRLLVVRLPDQSNIEDFTRSSVIQGTACSLNLVPVVAFAPYPWKNIRQDKLLGAS